MKVIEYPKSEFLERRRGGVGGSDIAGIMGRNKWSSPMQVYLEKMDLADNEVNDAMRMGNLLEPVVRQMYRDKNNVKVLSSIGDKVLVVEKQGPGFKYFYHPDGLVVNVRDEDELNDLTHNLGKYALNMILTGALEVKTSKMFSAWGDTELEIPDYAYLQCQWGCFVMDLEDIDLALLLGGSEYRQYTIERDEDLIKEMVCSADDFWESYVIPGTVPPPTDQKADREALSSLYEGNLDDLEPDAELIELGSNLAEAKKAFKIAEDQKRGAENLVKKKLGDHTSASCDIFKVTWSKPSSSAKVKWEAVAGQLLSHIPDEVNADRLLTELVESNTKLSKPSRRFNFTPFNEEG